MIVVDLFQFKDDLFFTGQLLFYLLNNQVQVTGVGYVIKVICRYSEHRA